jgi:signal transduction histidine kinase/PAS domain-containing protein/ActR/RegA family two-component response regulator
MSRNKTLRAAQSYSNNDPGSASTLSATERRINAGFAVALACLLSVAFTSYLSDRGLTQSIGWVEHTHEVLRSLDRLLSVVTDAETAERAYVISGEQDYLESYRQSLQASEQTQRHLAELTADNPTEQHRLDTLRNLVRERIGQFETVLELRRIQGFEAAQREILKGLGKRMHEQIRRVIDDMIRTEQLLLAERQRQARRSTLINQWVTWGGGGLAFAFVGLAAFAIRRDFVGRERAERGLRQAKEELELRVRQRTVELARANESLTESERRFRAFVSATSDVVYRVSADWTEMLHLQGQDFTPGGVEPAGDWIEKHIHPDDRVRLTEAIQTATRTKGTFELEHRVFHDDGTLGWIFSRAVPIFTASGEVAEWFGTVTDVTARKVAETRLQAQLERLALLSQITRAIGERQDIKSIFQVVIRTLEEHLPVDFCAICLYEPASGELTVNSVGRHSAQLAIELAMTEQARILVDQNGLSRCVKGQLVYEPSLHEVHFPFPRRLHQGGLNAFVAAPLRIESQVFGILLTARRRANSFSSGECEFLLQVSEHVALATHQAQLHGALQRAYDDLRQTQQAVMQQERLLALGKMASGIAHDINNAISPVALYTESLLERELELSPRTRQYLQTIQRAIDDVAHTVARMREFYRQREPLTPLRPVNLNQLVQQVIDLTRARWSDMAQQRGIAIEVQPVLAPELPAILGIEGELRDALTNLIFNAVDAMPEGGPLILRTQVIRKANEALGCATAEELVQVEVIDRGTGMDEDTRRRCFEPFFTTKGERGTGLGLAMVYGTAQRHNADIEVDSEPGKGTTMRLSFSAADSSGEPRASNPVAALRPLRILLVDDDPIVLKSLQDILQADGHMVCAADGGEAGINSFLTAQESGTPFEVVVTDLGMPYVDGRRVSAAIKNTSPDTIVLMLTGWGERLVANGETPAHVDRVLNKPPKLRELRVALAQCLVDRA